MPAKRMTPEGSVKRACEDLLKAERIPYWRMNAGNVVIPGRGRIRLNAAGTADLLAAPVIFSTLKHQDGDKRYEIDALLHSFLWIEVKSPNGKPSKEQLDFADFVRKRGHNHLFVNNVKILKDWLREMRAR